MKEIKIVVFGSGGVGKSSLTIQYVNNVFVEHYDPTIEDSYRKEVEVEGKRYMLEILDTAGTEQFTAMRDVYIRKGHGFLLVYSVTSKESLAALQDIKDHIMVVKNCSPTNAAAVVPMLIVGNKCDVSDSDRVVSKSQGQELAEAWNVPFHEASAKKRHNVIEIFKDLLVLIADTVSIEAGKTGRKSRCCTLL